jgi:rfaE bifunctional protein nucleotidyltransferase chain/domain
MKRKRVLATGVFDILHLGHLDYLTYAKSFGDFLIVHIESDQAVRRHKGLKRPINSENNREKMIRSLKMVDRTFIADGELFAEEILEKYQPDVFVIARKPEFNTELKEKFFKSILPNLKIVWFDKQSNHSTSRIVKKFL